MDDLDNNPAYLQSLFDPESDFSCYFSVGDPGRGPIERIGVVPPMLMAHSLLMRRMLNMQKAELLEKWDICITGITPEAFKNVLKYAYGFNNIKSYSIKQTMELLGFAEKWIMQPFGVALVKHMISVMTPVNVCLILQYPIALRVSKLQGEIENIIKDNPSEVLNSNYLPLICPESMRYIVLMTTLQTSAYEVWKAVIRWARGKVLSQCPCSIANDLDLYTHSKLVMPHLKYVQLCSLNLIRFVEEVISKHPTAIKNTNGISKYHFIPNRPPRTVYICTESKNDQHLKHEQFEVKVIFNCSSWMKPIFTTKSTVLITNSTDCITELYSLVCMGSEKSIDGLKDVSSLTKAVRKMTYDCKCLVKLIRITNSEDIIETVIKELVFQEEVLYDEEFHVLLTSNNEKLQCQPKGIYKIEIDFASPHPLWYTNTIDYFTPNQSSDLNVGCGLVNKVNRWYGCHAKYLVFNKLNLK